VAVLIAVAMLMARTRNTYLGAGHEAREQGGATVIKGPARLTGPGRVEAGGQLLEADHVVIATGSQPARPPVDGLGQVTVWTNREATNVRDIPPWVLLTAAAEVSIPDAADRSWTYERDPRGALGLLADCDRRVLVGAWTVAPLAGEWIHQAALAIRARIPIDTLLDQVAQYPTYSEAYLVALEQLSL